MKLCFIADSRSIHTQRWVAHFARKGDEVHLISYEPLEHPIAGVTEHVLPSVFGNLYLSFWPRHIRILLLLRKIQPDLVHAHFIAKYGYHLLFLGKRHRIASAWGDDILILPKSSRLIFWYTRAVLRSADLIYAVSEDIRNHIIQDFGIPEEKTRHLPFGVDLDMFPARDSSAAEGRREIVVFSNRGFLPVYGMETILSGFARAYEKNPGLRLVLKGEGPEKERLKVMAEERGLLKVVTFLSRTRYSDVPDDLRTSDIYVTDATSDGSPVSLLEAMATGLPCIASSVGGVPEWIQDGKNGLLVTPGDTEQLAEKILLLAASSRLRQELGREARTTVARRGDWSRLMRTAERDYETVAAGRKR